LRDAGPAAYDCSQWPDIRRQLHGEESAMGDTAHRRRRGVLRFIFCLIAGPCGAAAAQDNCATLNREQVYERLAAAPRVAAEDRRAWVPDGQPFSITVRAQHAPGTVMHAFFMRAGDDTHDGALPKPDIWKGEAVRSLRAFDKVAPDSSTTITISAINPGRWSFWQTVRVFALACTKKPDDSYAVILDTQLSNRNYSIIFAAAVVILFYLAAVGAVRAVRQVIFDSADATMSNLGGPAHVGKDRPSPLNPLEIAAGINGSASLALFQLFFFTLIVAGLVAYVLLRTGALVNLSDDVLILLGIAGVGTGAATITAVAKQRIAFENWSWLVARKWLPQTGRERANPRWSDLITSEGTFDASRFQSLVFSIIVGASLLVINLDSLATFSIPPAILGILGLSQVLYVGSKAAKPPTVSELDKALDELRGLERAFVGKTAAIWARPGVARDKTLADAIAQAPDEYTAFMNKQREVLVMFQSVIGAPLPGAILEPGL
jgi:hypothetical protein